MTESNLTLSKAWRRMTTDLRLRAARAFWAQEQAPEDHGQAVLLIAQQMKFRPKFVLGLEPERRARHLAGMVALPERLAARALVAYHLAEQREMMGVFLDALGLEHEDGVIEDDDVRPDPERIAPAVSAIAERFPAEDVSLYLTTLFCQDPDTWSELGKVPQIRQ